MKIWSVITVLVASLAPRFAAADPTVVELVPTCAAIDAADDLKDDAARAAARRLLAWTLEQQNLLVVETGCAETFRVSHRHHGGSVMVIVQSERGAWTWQNAKVDELPAIYRSLVTSLLRQPAAGLPVPQLAPATGTSPTATGTAPTGRTTTATPSTGSTEPSGPVAGVPQFDAPQLAAARPYPPPPPFGTGTLATEATPTDGPRSPANISLWYLRLGAGGAGGLDGGMLSAIGWRRMLDNYAVDIHLAGLASEAGSFGHGAFQVLKFRSNGESSVYYGGGLAYESVRIGQELDVMTSNGSGFGLAASVGVALNRGSSRGQAFLQADVGLPFYTANGARGEFYPASFGASFGFGFGRR